MLEPHRSPLGSLALIAIVIGASAAAFAYTAGWFSPRASHAGQGGRGAFAAHGPALGHRRNHAKGICFTGVFEANGAGAELSKAAGFRARAVSRARALQSRHPQSERGRTRRSACAAWGCGSRLRTARNGGAP